MSHPPRAAIAAGAVVAIGALVFTTGPLYRIRSWWEFSDPLAADVAVVAAQALFGALGAAVLVSRGRWRRVDSRIASVALALIAWMSLGALWSADASTTLRESLMVAATLVAGIGAAAAVNERVLVLSSWIGVQAGLAWSAVLIAAVQPGTQDNSGEWTGVYFNPNSLALVAAIGILLTLVVAAQQWRHPDNHGSRRWVVIAVLAVAVLANLWLISGTGSLAPLFALALGVGVAALAVVGRRFVGPGGRWPLDAGVVSSVVAVATLVVASIAWITRGTWLSAFGRSTTLTGRTDIWDVALDWVWKQPLRGQGYLGAWADPDFAAEQVAARGELLGSTHNSFIEVLLGAGIVGFVLMVALFALIWLAAGRRALTGRTVAAVWPFAALVFVLVENLAETLWVGGQIAVVLLGVLVVVSTSTDTAHDAPHAASDTGETTAALDGGGDDHGVADDESAEVVRGESRG